MIREGHTDSKNALSAAMPPPTAAAHALDGQIDSLIRHLYGSVLRVPLESYRRWALEQLHPLVDFDAALWGTGLLVAERFHYVAQLGLDEHYAERLEQTLALNPIRQGILDRMGQPVAMDDVYPDDAFFASELYQQLFQPYGIERILGSGHYEPRSGLSTLISLYRRARERVFTPQDRYIMARVLPHLIAAASHACFIHLEVRQPQAEHAAAICDQHGCYYEVQERFLDLIEHHLPAPHGSVLPFPLPAPGTEAHHSSLIATAEPLGKLFVVYLRPQHVLDGLTEREREIVYWITHGLSFKEVAKKLGVASSTVSNHLYRIYKKLGISSRTELAQLVLPVP